MNSFYKWLVLIFLSICIKSFSQEFEATTNKTIVAIGERFQVSFSLKNGDGSNFKSPDFKGFVVLSGPMQGQNIQIINGKTFRSVSFSYTLTTSKAGDYTINSASIAVGGNIVKSNPITIKVMPETDAQKQQNQENAKQDKELSVQAQDILKKNIFVKLNVSKKDVYLGEQITATYKLYVNPELNLIQMNPSKVPTFEGFWAQELSNDKLSWAREIIDGVAYNSAIIKQVVLFPQKSGKLTAEPYEFDFIVRLKVQGRKQQRNDPFGGLFDDFFSSSFKDFNYKAKSETGNINVKELPANQPETFNGSVGDITLDVWLDKTKTKTGEPVSLNVKISGRGNLKLIEPLSLSFPPEFEIYDPKINDNTNVSVAGMSGSKIFEYLMIPRNPGNFKIEPVVFSYFDLNTKQYKTLTSKEFVISVEKGNNSDASSISGVRKEDVQLIGKDIRYIKTKDADLEKNSVSFFGTANFFVWLFSPVAMLFIFIILLGKRRKFTADDLLVKNRRATKIAKRRLTIAKKCMIKNEKDKFYEEITKAMWGYLSDKLLISNSDLTKDKAKEILLSKNVNDELANKFLNTLDIAEFARYAPVGQESEMPNLYESSVSVITEIEGVLK